MFKFAINAGHWNGTTRGVPASISPNNHPNEWVLNDRVVDKVIEKLKKYEGISVLRIDDPTGKDFVEDEDRYGKANKFGADFYLGIHHNGGIGGGAGGGITAYCYLNDKFSGDTSVKWRDELYSSLIKHTGLAGNRATPKKRENLFEVRGTKMAAVLLELGFMDSRTDIKYILSADWADKCATAIVEVIVKRAKLKEMEEVFKKGEKSLGIYAMKRCLMIAKKFGVVPNNLEDDGGYGDGVDVDIKTVQKKAGLTQKPEADEATIRSLYKQTLDAINLHDKNLNSQIAALTKENKELREKISKLQASKEDVNGDGKVDTKDVLYLRKLLAKIIKK